MTLDDVCARVFLLEMHNPRGLMNSQLIYSPLRGGRSARPDDDCLTAPPADDEVISCRQHQRRRHDLVQGAAERAEFGALETGGP